MLREFCTLRCTYLLCFILVVVVVVVVGEKGSSDGRLVRELNENTFLLSLHSNRVVEAANGPRYGWLSFSTNQDPWSRLRWDGNGTLEGRLFSPPTTR